MGLNRNLGGLSPTALRGGPAFIKPPQTNGWLGFETDSRRAFRTGGSGWGYVEDETGSWGYGVNVNFSWPLVTSQTFTVPFSFADASHFPSGLNATFQTRLVSALSRSDS